MKWTLGLGFLAAAMAAALPSVADIRVTVRGIDNIERNVGPVPLAFDFGFPLLKEEGDRERVISFSFDLPF